MFRLHLDIPLDTDENISVEKTKKIAVLIEQILRDNQENLDIKMLQYRLGNDEDRKVKNHLVKDANGHVTEKKMRVILKEDEPDIE
jgi:divalent metal cation (Fe/Co/Zn/Cd) transporter